MRIDIDGASAVPCVAIMGHVGVGNLGDEAIIASIVARFRERAPNVRLIAFTLNPRDTTARHGIAAYPLRLYTERLLDKPQPDLRWSSTYAAKSSVAPQVDAMQVRGIARWIRRLPLLKMILRPLVVFLRWLPEFFAIIAFDWRSFRRLRGTTLMLWAGSGQVSDYVDGLGYPLVILRWTILGRLRGAKVAFASAGAGPVTKKLSRAAFSLAFKLSHYRSFRDPYSLDVARSLASPEPNHLVRDFAFSHPDLGRPPAAGGEQRRWIGINPLPFYGGEYWHILDSSVYDRYATAHAELAIGLLRNGHRVTLYPSNIRVDPRSVRRIVDCVRMLAPDVAPKLELLSTLDDVPALFDALRHFDAVVATRYHGVLLALACGTPAVGVVYHQKTRQVAEHIGVGEWCINADVASGEELLARVEGLLRNMDVARDVVRKRRLVDLRPLLEQYDLLAAMAGNRPSPFAQAARQA